MLTKEDVEHVADLARINLTQDEIIKYQAQLGAILNYMEKLQEVNTKDVPTADGGTIGLENIWREDGNSDKRQATSDKELINMAPNVEKEQVKVKSVF